MAVKGSAAVFAENEQDHVLPEGRKWPREAQQRDLQDTDKITYKLRAEKGRESLSSEISGKRTRSRTI